MADPLSIATGVAALVAAAWNVSNNLRDLRAKFQRVPETVSGLVAEFQATHIGLGQLNSLLRSRQTAFLGSNGTAAEHQHLLQSIDLITVEMARIFSLINTELTKLTKDDARLLTLRLRFLWAESDLNGYMVQMRDQRSSLVFLMQFIQTSKIDDIHRHFQSDSPGLSALRRTATRAKESRPLPKAHQVATGEPCSLGLDDILQKDRSFPDLDSITTPANGATCSQQSQPEEKTQHRAPTASPPIPTFENLNSGKGSPYPQAACGRPGASSPVATSRKATPTLVSHELHFAVANNDIQRVTLLLDAGHDPLGLPYDPYGSLPNAKKTSLALAAYLGREEIMRMFLQRGCASALNEMIGTDLGPFLAAAYAGHEKIVRLLLDSGADPRLRGAGGTAGLFWASSRGHARVVDLLMLTPARGDINVPSSKGLTPLMIASQHGRNEVVRILLSHGAAVSALNAKRQSALHLACHSGHFESAQLLLAHGARIDDATANGKTPLIFASISGHPDVCRLLLEAGAFANARDAEGKTALYHASSHGHGHVVEVLLSHGAPTETVTPQGDTALHIACEKGHARAVGALLSHGAGLEATRASDGLSALGIAMWYQRRGVLAPLILFQTQQDPIGYPKETALYAAAEWGLGEAVDALLEAGADMNALDGHGQTLVARAAREGKADAVSCLIEKGADVNKADKFGAMPIHRAARGGNLRVTEFLLSAGADVEGRDAKGLTPLHLAAVYGSKEMVEFLVGHGANVEAAAGTESNKGGLARTSLVMAAEHGRADMVGKLLGLGAVCGYVGPHRRRSDAMFIADPEGRVEVVVDVVVKEMVAAHA
ncbi:Ankyrin-1 [Madurella mycetomatis]|uniref:Ankyrin-1 n=1 Tax=Madurella mycetomatis TaxID=100816 RepID=A0A175W893_9PEZI|nr:Ankyrin-1 [Madurella mycetomatis]KXX80008.1 Ankyrin-1 [Madurella mycetomatis]